MTITSIKDALRALAQSLQISTVFPAGLFVLVNLYLVLPQVFGPLDLEAPIAVTLTISASLMLSYTLYAFNFPFIRLLEGYKGRELSLWRGPLEQQRAARKVIVDEIATLQKLRTGFETRFGSYPGDLDRRPPSDDETAEWRCVIQRMSELERRLDTSFPLDGNAVLPTSLGNTIRAWEDYAPTRYGMDTIALWPRLVPILRDRKFLDFVSQEKSIFDFLLNTCLVTFIIGAEFVYLGAFTGHPGVMILGFVLMSLLVFGLYQGMVIAARQWGTTVRVAFDLYRYDLFRRMALVPVSSFADERLRWRQVSDFLLYRREEPSFTEFIPLGDVDSASKKAS